MTPNVNGRGARGQEEAAGVCVVGAGPVGLTLALALVERGVRVVLLESGSGRGPRAPVADDNLLDGEMPDGMLAPLTTSRARGIGGTARIWNTLLAETLVAKYLPLQPIDLVDRLGTGFGGWPFGWEELARYLPAAARLCGTDPGTVTGRPEPVLGHRLETAFYAFGSRGRILDDLPSRLAAYPDVLFRTDRTVVELLLAPGGGRVEGVAWVDAEGVHGRVQAPVVVLTAGAIENARLLLLPTRRPAPWRELRWIGRGLMEHPVDRGWMLHTSAPSLCPEPRLYLPHRIDGSREPDAWRMGFFRLSEDRLEAGGLSNAGLRFGLVEPPGLVQATRSWRSLPGRAIRRVMLEGVEASRRLHRRLAGAHLPVHLDLEQRPDPENRVFLSNSRDRLGRPRAAIQWRWSSADHASHRRVVDAFADTLRAEGLGRLEPVPGVSLDPNAHHHAGTTRMHTDPDLGVVDPTLRVHHCEGLYVCGASVFPTAGFANPTLNAVAMAMRLAEHLQSRANA